MEKVPAVGYQERREGICIGSNNRVHRRICECGQQHAQLTAGYHALFPTSGPRGSRSFEHGQRASVSCPQPRMAEAVNEPDPQTRSFQSCGQVIYEIASD
jgi:hypothetical protein